MEVTGTPAQGVPAVPTEAAVPVETQAPVVEKSAEFVKKAQLEREMWNKQKAIKAQQAQIASDRAEIEKFKAEKAAFDQRKARALTNPDEYLAEAGLDYNKLSEYKLNNNAPTVDAQIQQLQAKLEAKERADVEREERTQKQAQEYNQKAAQEALENFKVETKDFVESKPEDYELINSTESFDLVIQTIEAHWAQSVEAWKDAGEPNDPKLKPKILSKEEAAGLVEKFLEEKVESVLKGKRFGSKYKRIEDAIAEVTKDVQADQKFTRTEQPTVKTLHNGMAASTLPGPSSAKSVEAKMQAALKRLQDAQKS